MTPGNEIVVFLPLGGAVTPVETARELIATLNVGRAAVGEDLLAGGIIVRLPYAPELWNAASAFLGARGVPYEIEVR